jgi:hypothetical protein
MELEFILAAFGYAGTALAIFEPVTDTWAPSGARRTAVCHGGSLLADCRYSPQAASWKRDEHGDAVLGSSAIAEGTRTEAC